MYKKILVPVDGSSLAECVLPHVKAIAAGCSVPDVDLLFVVATMQTIPYDEFTSVPTPGIMAEYQKRTEAEGKEYVAKLASGLQKDGVAAKSVVVRGNPAEHILSYAAKNGVDLIIMSTHGRSGVARWALGSVADRVVSLSTVPVMVVRHPSCVATP